MKISVKGFIYHKIAESFEDCFDRYAVNTETNKFSVSDGVSKSFFPGIWAELLVNSFVSSSSRVNKVDKFTLQLLQNDWLRQVTEIVKRPNQKFFVQNLFAQGRSAAATFVGLHFFNDNSSFRWEAIALGDSFLFFVPKSVTDITDQFSDVTFLSSKINLDFDNFPDFFDSRNNITKGKINSSSDILKEGRFYLMTDALSEWFLSEKQNAVNEILTWNSQKEFENRIGVLRKNELQNDDSAILIIDITDNGQPGISYDKINVSRIGGSIIQQTEYPEKAEFRDEENTIIDQFNFPPILKNNGIESEILSEQKPLPSIAIQPTPYVPKKLETKDKEKGMWEIGKDIFIKAGEILYYLISPGRSDNENIDKINENFSEEDRKKFEEKIGRSEPKKDFSAISKDNLDGKGQQILGNKKSEDDGENLSSITKKF